MMREMTIQPREWINIASENLGIMVRGFWEEVARINGTRSLTVR